MPILWIHRSSACDLLVEFSERRRQDAIDLGRLILTESVEDNNEVPYLDQQDMGHSTELINIGCNWSVQISLATSSMFYPSDFRPPYLSSGIWNNKGYARVTEDEARDLGAKINPLISNRIVTEDQLDRELDQYFANNTSQAITS
jgi:hypothetical protein